MKPMVVTLEVEAARNVRDRSLASSRRAAAHVGDGRDAPQSVMAAAQRPDSKCTLLHLLLAPRARPYSKTTGVM